MKRVIIFFLFFLALTQRVYCEQESKIELNDGSVINGEVVSFTNGMYTVNTSAFGQIKINADQVVNFQPASSSNNPLGITSLSVNPYNNSQNSTSLQGNNSSVTGIEDYKRKVMSNPENAAVITDLAANPQIQSLMEDPEIVAAAKAGDLTALMKSKKFMEIVNNPGLQKEIDKLKKE